MLPDAYSGSLCLDFAATTDPVSFSCSFFERYEEPCEPNRINFGKCGNEGNFLRSCPSFLHSDAVSFLASHLAYTRKVRAEILFQPRD